MNNITAIGNLKADPEHFVRCSDCRYAKLKANDDFKCYCTKLGLEFNYDFFCAYGSCAIVREKEKAEEMTAKNGQPEEKAKSKSRGREM